MAIARGERWAFAWLRNEIRITTASGAQLLERYVVEPEQGRIGPAGQYDYVASFFVVSDGLDSTKWPPLRSAMAEILDSMGDEVLGGVTEPPVSGLAIKLVAHTAEVLSRVQELLWEAVRCALLGLARPALRRY